MHADALQNALIAALPLGPQSPAGGVSLPDSFAGELQVRACPPPGPCSYVTQCACVQLLPSLSLVSDLLGSVVPMASTTVRSRKLLICRGRYLVAGHETMSMRLLACLLAVH